MTGFDDKNSILKRSSCLGCNLTQFLSLCDRGGKTHPGDSSGGGTTAERSSAVGTSNHSQSLKVKIGEEPKFFARAILQPRVGKGIEKKVFILFYFGF